MLRHFAAISPRSRRDLRARWATSARESVGGVGQQRLERRGWLGGRHILKPSEGATEEVDLIDALVRARVAQLGRPVGAEEDQGYTIVHRLDHSL